MSTREPKLFVDLKGTDAEWINTQGAQPIPLFEHTGNESRPYEENSIYLSYAVVVLPK